MQNDFNLEKYALFLEELGKSGGISQKLDPEKLLLMKDWEFPFKYKITKKIKDSYKRFDNKELVKLMHILMGYHYLEMFNYKNKGYYYGSPTFMQEQNLSAFDSLIYRFLTDFIKFNGGNYYFLSIKPISEIKDYPDDYKKYFRDIEAIKKIEEEKSHKELYQIIKNRDLKDLGFYIYTEELQKWERKTNRNIEVEINNYENWRKQQDWYPEHSKIIETQNKISKNKQLKHEIIEKIDKLQRNLIENQKEFERLEKIFNKNIVDFKRKINLEILNNKSPLEIILFLVSTKDSLDIYEPFSSKITTQEIQKIPKDRQEILKDKISKTNKKSGFRKLLKELQNS